MGERQLIAGALAASTSALFYNKIAMASGLASSIDKRGL